MSKRCFGCMEPIGDQEKVCPHCGYVAGTQTEQPIHLTPGALLHERYIVGRVLGCGGFGVTYIGWDGKLQQKVAIKEYFPNEFSTRPAGISMITVCGGDKQTQYQDGLKKFTDEAKRLAKFNSEPGIVKVMDSFRENNTAYIIMEFLDGETLAQYLQHEGTIPEDMAVDMLRPVMKSLKVIHAEGMIHRDISPDNIFLTKMGEIKLIDFGAARYAMTTHSRSLADIVKPGYSPEEQYRSRGDQGPHTDVYALAATLYKMITGRTPPDAMKRRSKFEQSNTDILIPPHKIQKKISVNREVAILNAMNPRIEDRTPDVDTFLTELDSDQPVRRINGKIKKLNFYAIPTWAKITVLVVMAAIILFSGLMLTDVINFSNYQETVQIPEGFTEVPDVEGYLKEDALQMIKDARLQVSTGGSVESTYIPAGKIVLQTPIAGSYEQINGLIQLKISSGAKIESALDGKSKVPYVVWDTLEEALAKLEEAGLGEPILKEAADETVEAGRIVSQSMEAGTEVEEGAVMELVLSTGPAPIAMLDMTGKQLEEAEEQLSKLGLVVRTEYEKNDSIPENCVIRQSIPKDTEVKRGDEVTLWISSGKETVTVPDVLGMSVREARKLLEEQGFRVAVLESNHDTVPSGKVFRQSPEAGSSQNPGAEIVLSVSKGPRPTGIEIANVVGLRERDAKSKLSDQGFTVSVQYEYQKSVEEGVVYAQTPDAGIKKIPGATVKIYVSQGRQPVSIRFDGNGGTVDSESKTVYLGGTYGSLPSASRTGYQFTGWYTASESRVISSTEVTNASSHVLHAGWSVNSYTLTFDTNGGDTANSSVEVPYGSAYGTLPTPSRAHYTFEGWYTSASGGTRVSSSDTMGSSDVTVYAHWSMVAYTVSWQNGNGYSIAVSRVSSPRAGASTGSLSSGGTVYYGDELQVTYTANEYYQITDKGAERITVSGNVDSSQIYASASVVTATYRVLYRSINGTDLGSTEVTHECGSSYTVTPPERSGYHTPSAQTVDWDTTSSKEIVFQYEPREVSNSEQSGKLSDWVDSGHEDPTVSYRVSFAYRNRTADSVEIQLTASETIKQSFYTNNVRRVRTSAGGTSLGDIVIVESWEWSEQVDYDRTKTASTAWVRVPVGTTGATSITIDAYFYDANANGTDLSGHPEASPSRSFSWTMNLPAY